jgi:hypothetical protein
MFKTLEKLLLGVERQKEYRLKLINRRKEENRWYTKNIPDYY